jgi:SanA protein
MRKTFLHKLIAISLKGVLYFVGFFFLVLLGSNLIIIISSQKYLYNNKDEVPPHRVALVLGTSRYLHSGELNPWFANRIEAAAKLYHAGKIDYIILSGDNRTRYYNEPEQMRREIVRYEVPDSILYLDYAGLRTLDSMVRSRAIFGQDSLIVISQKFHNQRAVFLARRHGVKAIGFNADDPVNHSTVRVLVREVFARVKVFVDLATRKQPRFLGDEIPLGATEISPDV